MIKLLHFSDAHIDIAGRGKIDPASGLPVRVLDFLKALDTIVDTAIAEKVDLVIFSGDAYRDRTPVPTYQREWGRRIARLSQAGIQVVLIVGNHDLSPAFGRAHALHEFQTLQVPGVHVIEKPTLLTPAQLGGLQVQVICMPWVTRSRLMTAELNRGESSEDVALTLNTLVQGATERMLDDLDPTLPAIMAAHATIEGATYGNERSAVLGAEMTLPRSLVKDKRLDYVALGHIHKAQNLNEGQHPPVIYPGSIERVDFGEVNDKKYFMMAEVSRGETRVAWRELNGRRFIDRTVTIDNPINVTGQLQAALPPQDELDDAVIRLTVRLPKDLRNMIDEASMHAYTSKALTFTMPILIGHDQRSRLSPEEFIGRLTAEELVSLYWDTVNISVDERPALDSLAAEVIRSVESEGMIDLENQEEVP